MMSKTLIVVLFAGALCSMGCISGITPQGTSSVDILDADYDSFPTAKVYVRCRDESGQISTNLSTKDFEFHENGGAVSLSKSRRVTYGGVPRNIVFVLDNISGRENEAVIDMLGDFMEGLRATDRVAAIAMTSQKSVSSGLSATMVQNWSQPGRLMPAARRLDGMFSSRPLGDAIVSAIRMTKELPASSRRNAAVVILAARDYRLSTSGSDWAVLNAINAEFEEWDRCPVTVNIIGVPQNGKSPSFHPRGLLAELAMVTGGTVQGGERAEVCKNLILGKMDDLYVLEFSSRYRDGVDGGKVQLCVTRNSEKSEFVYPVSGELVKRYARNTILPRMGKARNMFTRRTARLEAESDTAGKRIEDATMALGKAEGLEAKNHMEAARLACDQFAKPSVAVINYKYPADLASEIKSISNVPEVTSLDKEIRAYIQKAGQKSSQINGIRRQIEAIEPYAAAVVALKEPRLLNTAKTWGSFAKYVKSNMPKTRPETIYRLAWQCRKSMVDGLVSTGSHKSAIAVLTNFIELFRNAKGFTLTPSPYRYRAKIYCLGEQPNAALATADYQEAMNLDPHSAKGVAEYISFKLDMNQDDDAVAKAQGEPMLSSPELRSQVFWMHIRSRATNSPKQCVSLFDAAAGANILDVTKADHSLVLTVARAYSICGEHAKAVSHFSMLSPKELTLRDDRLLYAESLMVTDGTKIGGEKSVALLEEYGKWATKWPATPSAQVVARTLRCLANGYVKIGRKNVAKFIEKAIEGHCPGYVRK